MKQSMYHNREDAAILLADKLKEYKGPNTIILAIPRGGVPIGYGISRMLQLPLELAMAKKIGHPSNPEYAIGAVSLDDVFIEEEVSPTYIDNETMRIRDELSSRLYRFMDGRKSTPLKGKNVILVDDGIATGRTLIACIKSIRKQRPSRVIVAAPVASTHAASVLQPLADEFVCPLVSSEFYAVGQFYEEFDQVSDDEVKDFLARRS
jgi:putative phosphoribosyl transferase